METCKHCGKQTEKLVGLFVPHACKECMDRIEKEEIEKGHICRLCGNAYCNCCC